MSEIKGQEKDQVEEVVLKDNIDYDSINKDYFKNIKYQDLLSEFEKIGVASAWKPGKPANYMIKLALEKIAILKDLKKNGIVGDKAQDIADETQKENKVNKIKETIKSTIKDQETTKEARQKELDKIKSMNLSKDKLQSALDNTNTNLRNNPSEAQKAILLMKQSILTELLEEK